MAANLPLGFASIAVGGILVAAGLSGRSLAHVISGDATQDRPISAAAASQASSAASPTPGGSTAPASSPGAAGAPTGAGASTLIPGATIGTTAGAASARSAETHLGTPYSYGGGSDTGPTLGFAQGAKTIGYDCSALVKAAWASVGVALPRTAAAQWAWLQQKAHGTVLTLQQASATPGALLFFEPASGGPGHVAESLGGGYAVEAPHTGGVVQTIPITSLMGDTFVGAGLPNG